MKITYFINENEATENDCKTAIYNWAETDGQMSEDKAKSFASQVMRMLKQEATDEGIGIFARNGIKYIAIRMN